MKTLKSLLAIIAAVAMAAATFTSCIEDGFTTSPSDQPVFSTDTLDLGDLFTLGPSPTARFTSEGFLSVNKRSRRRHLEQVAGETRTMVFYEAPHKLRRTLSDFEKLFGGDRKIAVVRELTKVHEEVWRTTLGEAAAHYREKEPRGEYVLVIAGAEEPGLDEPAYTLEDAVSVARELLEEGAPPSEAAKQAAKTTGLRKAEIYRALTEENS